MDSEDESSEEDFFFLESAMKESNELDEVDRRLLIGIVQAPPKEKKRWDKEDPAEIRRRRRAKAEARGEHYSDSYDDETDHDGDDDYPDVNLNDGSGIELIGKNGKSMMHAVSNARNKAMGRAMNGGGGDVPLPCPDG